MELVQHLDSEGEALVAFHGRVDSRQPSHEPWSYAVGRGHAPHSCLVWLLRAGDF